MRTRYRSTITPTLSTFVDYAGFPTEQVVGTYTYPTFSQGLAERMVDETGPQWRQRLKTGTPVVRPMENRVIQLKRSDTVYDRQFSDRHSNGSEFMRGHSNVTNVSADVWMMGEYMHPFIQAADFREQLQKRFPYDGENAAVIRARLLQDCYGSLINAPALAFVSLYELEKTLESCKRLGTLLPRLWQFLKNNRARLLSRNGVLRATGNLAQQWLEYRYGFMQLYYDTMSYREAYGRIGKKRNKIIARRWNVRSSVPQLITKTSGLYYDQFYTADRYRQDTFICGLIVDASMPEAETLEPFGFGSPLSSLWEVVPFSFIVDWFIGVSDALAAFEGIVCRRVAASWATRRVTAAQQLQFRRIGKASVDANGDTRDGSLYQAQLTDVEVIKHVERIANPPAAIAALPQLKIHLNWKKCLDTASLLRGLRHDVLR